MQGKEITRAKCSGRFVPSKSDRPVGQYYCPVCSRPIVARGPGAESEAVRLAQYQQRRVAEFH